LWEEFERDDEGEGKLSIFDEVDDGLPDDLPLTGDAELGLFAKRLVMTLVATASSRSRAQSAARFRA